MSTPITTSAPKKASIWEDFIDIFVSPSEVFARREDAGFFLPMVVLVVVMLVLYFGTRSLFQPMVDAEVARQIAAAVRAHPEAAGRMQATAARSTGPFATIGGVAALVIGVPIKILITGVVLWLVGKLFASKQTVGAAFMVATFAVFPKILDWVVKGLQAALMDPAKLNSGHAVDLSVARLLNPDTTSRLLVALGGRVDLFIIWGAVLLAIGLSVTGKISRGRAAIAAVIVWLLGALPGVIGWLVAARMGMG
jgi:hypothetical protein